jgi:hypothetical protein
MDSRVDKVSGQIGANRVNQMKLEALSARSGKPIVSLGAYHDKPKNDPKCKPESMDAADFRGLESTLLMCEEARVLLTENVQVEAGLMNGAMGTLKGYMWPEGGDPNSLDPKLRSPLCLIVEFDSINLTDEHGSHRSFFPNESEKSRWVPVFRKKVFSVTEENLYREQYPLTLAWALTHWKAQGMTLEKARVHLSDKTVAVTGLAFVACTRVRHPWDLVFEEDLPEYEHFMKARSTLAFRSRKRWELRLQERSSETLRRYGFCEEDLWTKSEADAAQALLNALNPVASRQHETLCNERRFIDDADSWIWPGGEPAYESLLRDACVQVAREDENGGSDRTALLASVSERLLDKHRRRKISAEECAMADKLLSAASSQGLDFHSADILSSVSGGDEARFARYAAVGASVRRRMAQVSCWDGMLQESVPVEFGPLHISAVKGVLGSLIPANLHSKLDGLAKKQKLPGDVVRGGSFLKLDGWRVSVYEEDALARGRLDKGMLFFSEVAYAHCF